MLENYGMFDVVGFSDGGYFGANARGPASELVRRLVISGVNIAPEGLRPEDLEELARDSDREVEDDR